MIYLYYQGSTKTLYLFESIFSMKKFSPCHNETQSAKWENVESVTQDPERRQVLVHSLGKGIIVEFPESKTVLACQKPV